MNFESPEAILIKTIKTKDGGRLPILKKQFDKMNQNRSL